MPTPYTGWCTACLLTRVQTGRSAAIFRADRLCRPGGGDFHGRKILIVSDRPPAAKVDGLYGEVISKSIPAAFLSHSRYRFQVQVNPVRKDKQTGKRVAVKGRADIAQWFIQRAASRWGFDVDLPGLQVEAMEVLQFKDKAGRQVTLGKATVQGCSPSPTDRSSSIVFIMALVKGEPLAAACCRLCPLLMRFFPDGLTIY